MVVPGQPLRYQLGVRLFQLGSVFAQQLDLAREAQRVATEVAAECGETVHVAVLEGTDVIYIARVESTHPVRMVSAVGRRLPAHCTGVGKMLLSDLSAQTLNALYPKQTTLPSMTPNSIPSLSRLKTELAEIRTRGLAYDEAESSEDVHCVAAGVRDHTGEMVAGLSISVPITRWDDARRLALASWPVTGRPAVGQPRVSGRRSALTLLKAAHGLQRTSRRDECSSLSSRSGAKSRA